MINAVCDSSCTRLRAREYCGNAVSQWQVMQSENSYSLWLFGLTLSIPAVRVDCKFVQAVTIHSDCGS